MENKETKQSENSGQTIIVNGSNSNTNGVGIAGFVLALIALFLGWIPIVGWLIWVLGLILSIVGVFNKPRGFAIAGLVISLIGVIFLLVIFASIGALLSVS